MKIMQRLRRLFVGRKEKFKLFQLEPTPNCNLNCIMCPWTDLHSHNSDMSWQIFERTAWHFSKVQQVDFTCTGEPLLHPRLEDMVKLAKDKGCRVGFSTNATLLHLERARALIGEGLDWIAYSVDAATRETYEKIGRGGLFKEVLTNIQMVRELREKTDQCKLETSLFYVMMKENIHELPNAVNLAHDLGIDLFVAKNLDVILKKDLCGLKIFCDSDKEVVDILVIQAAEEVKMRAERLGLKFRLYNLYPEEQEICQQDPLATLFVSFDGAVSPCVSLSYIEKRFFGGLDYELPVLRFGNISEEELETVWSKREYKRFRNLFRDRVSQKTIDLFDVPTAYHQERQELARLPKPVDQCAACYYLYGI